MRNYRSFLLHAAILALLPVSALPYAGAQITNTIEANISHPFIIANTTLPAGKYYFRVVPDSNLSLMTASSADGKTTIEFLVHAARDNHRPNHSQLIFERYGHEEFLKDIFEGGSAVGSRVLEPSRLEAQLRKEGQQPTEHTETQAG